MTVGLKPFLVKGDAAKEAAWERLAGGFGAGAAALRRSERAFSVVWGVVLLPECVVRIVGAYTVPVDTMVWLGSVVMIVAMVIAFVVSGGLAAEPMQRLIAAQVEAAAVSTVKPAAAVAA